MIDQKDGQKQALHEDAEMAFIRAFHRAIFLARGKIWFETMGANVPPAIKPSAATTNRWKRLMERIRLALINAKTERQTQDAISEVLARCGVVEELRGQEALWQVKQLVFGTDWQRVRDLALFALASYQRPPDAPAIPDEAEDVSASDNFQPTE